ncbi:hypothetical protein PGQ11_002241 [Apiospora arundinis]|uniref:Uncharacterized protein n=1 Tax=Apiospora arundinis TaxID=335852 RepID=A0ABR2JHI8_9PEZI
MATSTAKFEPTAAEFKTRPASIDGAVLDNTIVTRSLPDIDDKTLLIGLLAVPNEKSGANKEAWHITDFLAIKTLVTGIQTNSLAQAWMSQCDTEAIVKGNPATFIHGPEHRVVGGAAVTAYNSPDHTGLIGGQIPIVFEPNTEEIKKRFLEEICKKSIFAVGLGFQVIVIISGRTTLEQDVYLDGYDVVITSQEIRSAMVAGAQATVITPSLTSAGWQINQSFNEDQASLAIKQPIDFLSRQCGGIFSRTISEQLLGWKSPFIDDAKFDPSKKTLEAHPGPAMPDTEQLRIRSELTNETHALLAARLFPDHYDHSFSFDAEKDTWTQLISGRKNEDMLETYSKIWNNLDTLPPSSANVKDRLSFLGTAFGGNRLSQISHLKHLVQESFPSWPGYYTSTFGQNVRAEFEKFLGNPNPTDLDCHVIFSIVEYRMTTMVLGDLLIKYAGLDLVWAQRCRDWDEERFNHMVRNEEVSKPELGTLYKAMNAISRLFPYFYIPPGRVLDSSKLHHQAPPRISRYLALGLALRYREVNSDLDAAVARVLSIIDRLKDKQVELLLGNEDFRKKGEAWWKSIEDEVTEDVSVPEHSLVANFVPPPPELVAPNTGIKVVRDLQVDTAEQTVDKGGAQETHVAEIDVQSPEQPATPSGKDGMPEGCSPVFEIAQDASPEIKIETPSPKTGTLDITNIREADSTLASAESFVPPHLRKVWKPKSPKPVERKPADLEGDNTREELEEEVSVQRFVIPEHVGANEAHPATPELHAAEQDCPHDEDSEPKSPVTTKPGVPEVDKNIAPHLRGKGNPVTLPSYR